MLIPKFLLLTIAVMQNATSPIVNPLTVKVMKSNHKIALDQNLMSKISPPTQKKKLIIQTLIK